MRHILITVAVLAWCVGSAAAQSGKGPSGYGYAFFAPGTTSPGGIGMMHLGGGGEAFLYKGLAAGVELGYLTPWHSIRCGVGTLSAGGSYHFSNPRSGRRVVPFGTGGYALLFRNGTANAFFAGGGVHWWFREKVGLRLEFRDTVWPESGRYGHLLGIRMGLAFR